MTFTQAFMPATNKDGYSKLTFLGIDIKSGLTPVTDKEGNEIVDPETGEIKTKQWTFCNFCFEVMGRVRGTSQVVNITVHQKYSEDNLLGKTLKAMGFQPPVNETVLDEDGFEVEAINEDEDGMGQEDEDSFLKAVEEFIEASTDKVFLAKVRKQTQGKRKGFYEIDVTTLKPKA